MWASYAQEVEENDLALLGRADHYEWHFVQLMILITIVFCGAFMRPSRFCCFFVCASALILPSFAGIRPSFSLDFSAWNATDIAVAEITTTDGVFAVVESWKGNLKVGEKVSIPELRPDVNAPPISEYPDVCGRWEKDTRGISTRIPRQPVGSQIVLFLRRSQDSSAGQRPSQTGSSDLSWRPSDLLDSMQASAVWIGGSDLYAFRQIINPGLPILCKLPSSETEMRTRVLRITKLRRQFDADRALPPGKERASHLQVFVRSKVFPAKLAALGEIGKSGPDAVPIISQMLDDPSLVDDNRDLIDALVEAGGGSVGKELDDRLADELKFWKAEGPSLQPGWWNSSTDVHAPLRTHYSTTYELLLGLEKVRYGPALTTVTQLRKLWRELPPLAGESEADNEVLHQCDTLIGKLAR
jgi:hypothetical protein